MIDFHCHVDLYPQPDKVIDEIISSGMYVLIPTTTPRAWYGTCTVAKRAQRVRVALGLHPELVAERFKELELFLSLLPEARYVGEVGLDGAPGQRTNFDIQERAFEKILASCSDLGGRILTIHSRAAVKGVLDILDQYPKSGIPVLHWFTGTLRELERAVLLGCWFSVGPSMLRSRKGCQLVEAMPRDRILTETDGPFARKGSAPLVPSDVSDVEKVLASIWGLPGEKVRLLLLNNFRHLLSFQ